MILISGDSWGAGAWKDGKVYHRGLEQYLHDDGHSVVNLSIGGGSNFHSIERITNFLKTQNKQVPLWHDKEIDSIIVFQTEWHRAHLEYDENSYKTFIINKELEEWHQHLNVGDDQKILSRYYSDLSDVSQGHNIPIGIVGGCSDTVWIDEFESQYPGLYVICQSFSNLVVNNNHRIDPPVYTINLPPYILEKVHASINGDEVEKYLFDMVDLGNNRIKMWNDNPEWFKPDGGHPNHTAHKKLFDYIKSNNLLRQKS